VLERPSLPAEPIELPPALEPEALIAEARRRQRRRRVVVAVVLVGLLAAGSWLHAAMWQGGGTPAPARVSRPATIGRTLRLHLLGFGTPLPGEIDRGPCPQGQTLVTIRSAAGTSLGVLHECVLTIARVDAPSGAIRRIRATTRDAYSLPGGTIVTRESHTILFARDQRHTTAIFRGRILRGTRRYAHAHGTLSGGGRGVEGKADWVVDLRLAP
jgi:hypothetical protein